MKMLDRCSGMALGLAAWCLIVQGVFAAATSVSYQGVLRDSEGQPVPDGAYPVSVSIFSTVTGGTALWQESHPAVTVTSGAFSIVLGELSVFGTLFQNNPSLFLEVAADTGSGLTPFTPRVPLTSAPYAQQALNADTVDGVHAASLEESAEIDADIAAHNADANAHAGLAIDAAQIVSGTVDNARLNMGPGNGLDADTVDGVHAAELEESAEIVAAITAHDTDANAHADIRQEIDSDIAAHDADANAHADIRAEIGADIALHDADASAHPNLTIDAAQIATGTVANARLSMGTGNGLDADTVDGAHAAALEESAEIDADIAAHNVDTNAHANLNINAAQLVAGTVNIARLPTGTGASNVALGNHSHDAAATISGIFDIARLPVGTGATQVAVGNHGHDASAISSGTLNVARIPVGTGAGQVAAGNHTHAPNWKVTKAIPYQGVALNRSGNFTCSAGSTIMIHASASAFLGVPGALRVDVRVDGVVRGSLRGYTNEASSHKALSSDVIVLPGVLGAGAHTVELILITGITDFNDFSQVTIHELIP